MAKPAIKMVKPEKEKLDMKRKNRGGGVADLTVSKFDRERVNMAAIEV